MNIRILLCVVIHSCLIAYSYAQPPEQEVKIMLAPERADWTYKPGDPVNFTVSVFKNGNPIRNVWVRYETGPEKMPAFKKDSLKLGNNTGLIKGGTMREPGFLRCIVETTVDGKVYRELATAAFQPENIQPTVKLPADFTTFWDKAKSELAGISMNSRMTLMPERCTDKVNVYYVKFKGYWNADVHGILCIPKKEGRYPAVLRVPGAGIRAYNGDIGLASKGFITLEIGIHGIPVNLEPEVYGNLASGALRSYYTLNLHDRDKFYYKRVYLATVRSNDFLTSLPQYDGLNLGVIGGSQGGALAIVTAALDPRVKYLAAYYPALSDLTGYLQGRAGGWPHYFQQAGAGLPKEAIETTAYYDVVNFARMVKAPGIYTLGFNDEVCPPTSMYAAYNVISAPKQLEVYPETGHWTYPAQRELMDNWLMKKLSGN